MFDVVNYASVGGSYELTVNKVQNVKREDIEKYLEDPTANSQELRAISDNFYYKHGVYRNIVDTFTTLATLDYSVLPTAITAERKMDKSYDKLFLEAENFADTINIKLTTRRILSSYAKYGGFVGYLRKDGNSYYVQTLPIDYCRIKYKLGNDYQIEFNFKYFDNFFDEEEINLAWEMYPKEFKSLYNKYQKDNKSREPEWQMLDIKNTYTVKCEEDSPFFIPPFCGMFESIDSDNSYKDLMKLSERLDAIKLIVQKIPTDPKTGKITVSKTQTDMLHENMMKLLPEGANGMTTPLEIQDVSFANANRQKQDMLKMSERGVFINSGWSSSLFADNSSHTGLSTNVETVVSKIYYALEKCENAYNIKLSRLIGSKNYNFKIEFLKITNINRQETFDMIFRTIEIGGSLVPLLSILGFSVGSYKALLEMESNSGIKELLVPPSSMHTQSSKDGDVGNVEKTDSKITEAGAKTKESGSNKDRK